MREQTSAGNRLSVGLIAATAMSLLVVASALSHESAFGATTVWPWLLTGLQVLSLWSAGRRYWWGWLMGGSVQLPWIAYAVMTEQIGFIPGCVISASVQLHSFLRNSSSTERLEAVA